MIESAHDYAIFSMDTDGKVTSWNNGAYRLTGWAADEIIGRTADLIFTEEDRADAVPERERSEASANGRALDDRWQRRKDGSRFWASGLLMRLDRRELGFAKILRDRTPEHMAELRVEASERRFRTLATNIPQLVFLGRVDGNRTWPSPQWVDFTGIGQEESLGLGWLDAIHPDDREATLKAWREAERTGAYYVEHRVRRRFDGQYRWHQTRARPLDAEAPRTQDWVGTMTDVHDMRGLQERQKVLMAELQHRTRNLVALVRSIAQQTRRRHSSLDVFGREFDERLSALGRVQALITGVDYHNVDLADLITAELHAHDGTHLDSGRVTVDGPLAPLPARAAQSLGLALHELMTNAAKYGALARGEGHLSIAWRFEDRGPGPNGGRWLVLVWKESGLSLTPQSSPRSGYGRELIERALPYDLGAETRLDFEPDGVRCTIAVALEVAPRE